MANSLSVQEVAWYENPAWERHVIVAEHGVDREPGRGRPRRRRHSRGGLRERLRDGSRPRARANCGSRAAREIPVGRGRPRRSTPSPRPTTWSGWTWTATAGRSCSTPRSSARTASRRPTIRTKRRSSGTARTTGSAGRSTTRSRASSIASDPSAGTAARATQLLVASFEGIGLYRATGSGAGLKFEKTVLAPGHDTEKAPRLGASDVAAGMQAGRRFFASVEPWHGNEVVVYTGGGSGWQRRVIFDQRRERPRGRNRRSQRRRPRRRHRERQRARPHAGQPRGPARRRARLLRAGRCGVWRVAAPAGRGQRGDERVRARRPER